MILPKETIIVWQKGDVIVKPSDHSRSELSVDVERIGDSNRMANARLRKYHVADKRSWSASWTLLPAPDEYVVNGHGGKSMEAFFNNTKGEFQMRVHNVDTDLDETVSVMFTEFSKGIAKRGAYDMWNVSMTVEEC